MNSEPVSFPFLFGLLIYLYTFLVLLFPIILIEVKLIYIILFVLGVISSNLFLHHFYLPPKPLYYPEKDKYLLVSLLYISSIYLFYVEHIENKRWSRTKSVQPPNTWPERGSWHGMGKGGDWRTPILTEKLLIPVLKPVHLTLTQCTLTVHSWCLTCELFP